MPLNYLLFRCPRCGEDGMEGTEDEASCLSCGTRFGRGGEGGRIRVSEASGAEWQVASHKLSATVQAWEIRSQGVDGGLEAEQEGPRSFSRRAMVDVRVGGEEEPVWFQGNLLGFAEALGMPSGGVLEVSNEALTLWKAEGSGTDQVGERVGYWPLLEIRAVQTSSATVQISPQEGGLVQFRFQGDSPYRWECLLRWALSEAYRRAGLGEIKEFQPRVVVE